MDLAAASWFVLLLALLGANLPFLNQRLLAVIALQRWSKKPLWVRLLEMAFFYLLIGLLARVLEGNVGGIHEQGGWFYAITICIFLVFAFPGFVFSYLLKRRN